jgi:mRNA interferase RelE/StbE
LADFKVEWTEEAVADLEALDPPIRKRLVKKIGWFVSHFSTQVPEPLSGELSGAYKIRIGDWRVIYVIEEDTIVIHSIGHRREIYRK